MVERKTLKLGVMQGRLTEKGGFFPQSFPWDHWEEEFLLAKDIGFHCLEWMFNSDRWEENPVVTKEGISKIRQCINDTGIEVSGICANYFMDHCVYDSGIEARERNRYILNTLVENADEIGCSYIILPAFEKSGTLFERPDFWKELCLLCQKTEWGNIRILIETDAPMHIVGRFLEQSPVAQTGICYDLGNAAGLGKDVLRELQTYFNLIEECHVKDKKRGAGTIMLGEGDVPYQECIDWLIEYKAEVPLILESYYGVHAVDDTRKNLQFIKDKIRK